MRRHHDREAFWQLQQERRPPALAAEKANPLGYAAQLQAVLSAAHESIATALAPDGFVHDPDHQWLSRTSDGLIHRIAFTTSDANIPDEFTALYVHYWVLCLPLAAWRKEVGDVDTEYLAIRHLDSWEQPRCSLEHDIGPPGSRDAEITDIVERIRREGLPFFQAFATRPAALGAAATWPSLGFATYEIGSALDWAMFLGDRQTAQALADRFLETYPTLANDYRDFALGVRRYPSAGGSDLFAHEVATRVQRHQLRHPPLAAI